MRFCIVCRLKIANAMKTFAHLWIIRKSQHWDKNTQLLNYKLGSILVQSFIEIGWKLSEKLAGQDYRKVKCDKKFHTSNKNLKITESGNKIPIVQLHIGVNTCAKFNRIWMKTLREVSRTRLCLRTDGQTTRFQYTPPNFVAGGIIKEIENCPH